MGLHHLTPAGAGIRQRDDYGAATVNTPTPACIFLNPLSKSYRIKRSFPVVQPRKVDAMGRLNHGA
ncbi:hypothetical protein EHS86_10145 [Erwinia amylovora]|nr:hypothetical protein AD997_10890 [Erwinia amylovora]RWS38187.1 hypothetical protein EHS86_10145 [Erwinia amylovora]